MRTYGRITIGEEGGVPVRQWIEVQTDANGLNDQVYLTSLAQVLLLFINESPFFANWGIPARDAIMQQVFPDFYVVQTQQRFADKFASIIVARRNLATPVYDINVITHQGVKITAQLPVPT